MTTHIFNLVRLKDLASKDPTISPDISVWEKMAENGRKRQTLGAVTLTADQASHVSGSLQADLLAYFGEVAVDDGDDDEPARSLHKAHRQERHWLAHGLSGKLASDAILRSRDANPVAIKIFSDWFEAVFKTSRFTSAATLITVVITDGQTAFNCALQQSQKNAKEASFGKKDVSGSSGNGNHSPDCRLCSEKAAQFCCTTHMSMAF